MKLLLGLLTAILLGIISQSFALEPKDMERLRKARVGENVIMALIEEKSIETCAFEVDEIIRLKETGFSDKSIEQIVRKGSFLKGKEVVVYGKETVPLRATSIKDLMDLKEKGFSDDIIKAIILISAEDVDTKQRKEAMELLKSMGILLDMRSTDAK